MPSNLPTVDDFAKGYIDGNFSAKQSVGGKLPSIDDFVKTYIQEQAPEPSSLSRRALDYPTKFVKGVAKLPNAIVGLADIPTGGQVGKFIEDNLGYDFEAADQFYNPLLTPEYRQSQKEVSDAFKNEGFVSGLGSAITHPSQIAGSVAESLPSMLAGGWAGKAVGAALKAPAWISGAIGEGLITAGSGAEDTRVQTQDRLLTPEQSALSLGTGLLTGGISAASGGLANKFGIADPDTLIANGMKFNELPVDLLKPKSLLKQTAKGMAVEGAEEFLQSGQETIGQNLALGKPYDEGLTESAGLGMLSGMAMGGPINTIDTIKNNIRVTELKKIKDDKTETSLTDGSTQSQEVQEKKNIIEGAFASLNELGVPSELMLADKGFMLQLKGLEKQSLKKDVSEQISKAVATFSERHKDVIAEYSAQREAELLNGIPEAEAGLGSLQTGVSSIREAGANKSETYTQKQINKIVKDITSQNIDDSVLDAIEDKLNLKSATYSANLRDIKSPIDRAKFIADNKKEQDDIYHRLEAINKVREMRELGEQPVSEEIVDLPESDKPWNPITEDMLAQAGFVNDENIMDSVPDVNIEEQVNPSAQNISSDSLASSVSGLNQEGIVDPALNINNDLKESELNGEIKSEPLVDGQGNKIVGSAPIDEKTKSKMAAMFEKLAAASETKASEHEGKAKKASKGFGKGGFKFHSGIDPTSIFETSPVYKHAYHTGMAIVHRLIVKGALTFAKWAEAMHREYGDDVVPSLKMIWKKVTRDVTEDKDIDPQARLDLALHLDDTKDEVDKSYEALAFSVKEKNKAVDKEFSDSYKKDSKGNAVERVDEKAMKLKADIAAAKERVISTEEDEDIDEEDVDALENEAAERASLEEINEEILGSNSDYIQDATEDEIADLVNSKELGQGRTTEHEFKKSHLKDMFSEVEDLQEIVGTNYKRREHHDLSKSEEQKSKLNKAALVAALLKSNEVKKGMVLTGDAAVDILTGNFLHKGSKLTFLSKDDSTNIHTQTITLVSGDKRVTVKVPDMKVLQKMIEFHDKDEYGTHEQGLVKRLSEENRARILSSVSDNTNIAQDSEKLPFTVRKESTEGYGMMPKFSGNIVSKGDSFVYAKKQIENAIRFIYRMAYDKPSTFGDEPSGTGSKSQSNIVPSFTEFHKRIKAEITASGLPVDKQNELLSVLGSNSKQRHFSEVINALKLGRKSNTIKDAKGKVTGGNLYTYSTFLGDVFGADMIRDIMSPSQHKAPLPKKTAPITPEKEGSIDELIGRLLTDVHFKDTITSEQYGLYEDQYKEIVHLIEKEFESLTKEEKELNTPLPKELREDKDMLTYLSDRRQEMFDKYNALNKQLDRLYRIYEEAQAKHDTGFASINGFNPINSEIKTTDNSKFNERNAARYKKWKEGVKGYIEAIRNLKDRLLKKEDKDAKVSAEKDLYSAMLRAIGKRQVADAVTDFSLRDSSAPKGALHDIISRWYNDPKHAENVFPHYSQTLVSSKEYIESNFSDYVEQGQRYDSNAYHITVTTDGRVVVFDSKGDISAKKPQILFNMMLAFKIGAVNIDGKVISLSSFKPTVNEKNKLSIAKFKKPYSELTQGQQFVLDKEFNIAESNWREKKAFIEKNGGANAFSKAILTTLYNRWENKNNWQVFEVTANKLNAALKEAKSKTVITPEYLFFVKSSYGQLIYDSTVSNLLYNEAQSIIKSVSVSNMKSPIESETIFSGIQDIQIAKQVRDYFNAKDRTDYFRHMTSEAQAYIMAYKTNPDTKFSIADLKHNNGIPVNVSDVFKETLANKQQQSDIDSLIEYITSSGLASSVSGSILKDIVRHGSFRNIALQKVLEKIANIFGTRLLVVNAPTSMVGSGMYHDGAIIINANGGTNIKRLFAHEMFHHLMSSVSPEQFKAFQNVLMKSVDPIVYQAKVAEYLEKWSAANMINEGEEFAGQHELCADLFNEVIGRPEFWANLYNQDMSFAQKVFTRLAQMITKITDVVKTIFGNEKSLHYENNVLIQGLDGFIKSFANISNQALNVKPLNLPTKFSIASSAKDILSNLTKDTDFKGMSPAQALAAQKSLLARLTQYWHNIKMALTKNIGAHYGATEQDKSDAHEIMNLPNQTVEQMDAHLQEKYRAHFARMSNQMYIDIADLVRDGRLLEMVKGEIPMTNVIMKSEGQPDRTISIDKLTVDFFKDIKEKYLDKQYKRLDELLGKDKDGKSMLGYTESHFGQMLQWMKPDGMLDADAMEYIFDIDPEASKIEGRKVFLKERGDVMPSKRIQNGMKPVILNPYDLALNYMKQTERLITFRKRFELMKKQGRVKLVMHGQDIPKGFASMNDNALAVYHDFVFDHNGKAKEGKVDVGQYFVQEGFARMMNNALSTDYIRRNPIGRTLVAAKNRFTAVELGLSAFHGFTIMNEYLSALQAWGYQQGRLDGNRLSSSFNNSVLGNLINLTYNRVNAFTRVKEINDLFKQVMEAAPEERRKIVDSAEFKAKAKEFIGNDVDVLEMIHLYFKAGGGSRQDASLRFHSGHIDYSSLKSIGQSIKDTVNKELADKYDSVEGTVKAGLSIAEFAALKVPTDFLFEEMIPKIKFATFCMEYAQQLQIQKKELDAKLTTKEQIARQQVTFNDQRFGEMNWNNLWMNNNLKTALMLTFRSFTWKYGTFAALYGGGKSVADFGWKAVQKHIGGKKEIELQLDQQGVWFISAIATHIMLAAIIQSINGMGYGGDDEEDENVSFMSKLLYPKVEKGERVAIPSYATEFDKIYSHIKHGEPSKIITGSFNGLLVKLYEIYNNRTNYDNIYVANPEDNIASRTVSKILHLLPAPISATGFSQAIKQGQGLKSLEKFAGLQRAPQSVTLTSAELKAKQLRKENMAAAPQTEDDVELNQRWLKARREIEKTGYSEELKKLKAEGLWSKQRNDRLYDLASTIGGNKNSHKKDNMMLTMEKLSVEDKISVWKKMTEPEKLKYRQYIKSAINRSAASGKNPIAVIKERRRLAKEAGIL